jgi:hypothetical protein
MMRYNRTVHPDLLDVLKPGGWASSLVEYARFGQHALDLQLRGYDNKQSCWATLYLGLTKVLDLHFIPKQGFRLDVHPTWKMGTGWSPEWEVYRRSFTPSEWQGVEAYLETVIPKVGRKFLVEGVVQSAVSAFQSRNLTVIDREAAISFSNQAEKDRIGKKLSGPLLGAIEAGAGPETWWKGRPDHLGGECDALAVAGDGTLLAIEIKPKGASTIPWAPLQARHYANLFSEWARTTPNAPDIIDGMLKQRADLGLNESGTVVCKRPVEVRPILAIERGMSTAKRQRLEQVERVALDGPRLEIFEVNLAGRLDPLEP